MQGLEISRAYFTRYGLPMLESGFGDYTDKIAAGLVGQGSECFGFDDEFSRDHDFGPGFCLWLPEDLDRTIGPALQEAYDALPQNIDLCETSMLTPERGRRVGVHAIGSFYRGLIGRPDAPQDNLDWLRIPERFLATAANGQVFQDPLGEFSRIRSALLAFYPQDVALKRLAARCAVMGQAGQYNYVRCIRRKAYAAANLACGEFAMAALGALYLLNRKYMPFYKWAFRGTENFVELGECARDVETLVLLSDERESSRKMLLIEKICIRIQDEIRERGGPFAPSRFMQDCAEQIMGLIQDPQIRSLPILAD